MYFSGCTVALTVTPSGCNRWWEQPLSVRYSVSIKGKLPEESPDSPPAVWHIFSFRCWRPSHLEASSSFSLISLSLLWLGYRKNLEITSSTHTHTHLYVDSLLPPLPVWRHFCRKIPVNICGNAVAIHQSESPPLYLTGWTVFIYVDKFSTLNFSLKTLDVNSNLTTLWNKLWPNKKTF